MPFGQNILCRTNFNSRLNFVCEEGFDAYEKKRTAAGSFDRAKQLGDDRVFFLDSREIFKDHGENNCFVDGSHPTDLGFWLIAQKMNPIMERCLKLSEK